MSDVEFVDNHVDRSSMNGDACKFYGYVEDDNQVVYRECKFTKLSVIICLFCIKCICKVADKAFGMLFDHLGELISNGKEKLPVI